MIGWRAGLMGMLGLGAAALVAACEVNWPLAQAPKATASGAPASEALDSPWPQDWISRPELDGDRWRTRRMGPKQKQRLERHQAFMASPHIQPYMDKTNPLPATGETLAAGAAVYAEHCVRCHGATGFGNGDAGYALDPSPALLAFMVQMPRAVDGYLLWAVSDGGAAFGSEMPAYKGVLSEKEMWEVIAYMRSGFGGG